MSLTKLPGVGTNPRTFNNDAILSFVSPRYHYLTANYPGNAWSLGFETFEQCYQQASQLEATKFENAKLNKKGKR